MMRFTKMHGLGNDYVYVNGFEETLAEPSETAVRVSDRHFGIGSDGLILILPSDRAAVRMRMFNADGSEAEMCGNGLRCLAKYACDHGLVQPGPLEHETMARLLQAAAPAARLGTFAVETGAGVLTVAVAVVAGAASHVCVDMGAPELLPSRIPVDVTGQQAVGVPFELDEQRWLMTCVSMGNPHAVFFVDDVAAVDLERWGPRVETHRRFPRRVNVHFVQRLAAGEVRMRTWERGSGVTLACGTGAAAVCVAGVLASKTQRRVLAHLPGGDLHLEWDQESGHVYKVGPAVEVFSGCWPG